MPSPAQEKRWKHWASIATVLGVVVSTLVFLWGEGIIKKQANSDNPRPQSPKLSNPAISNSGNLNLNLGNQSNSGNSASGNGKQVSGVDNSANYYASNITIIQNLDHAASLVPTTALAPPVDAPQFPAPIKPADPTPIPSPKVFPGPVSGNIWPTLGDTYRIEITGDLGHGRFPGAKVFEFEQPVDQGDRLHFDVVPANGAAMRTVIQIFEENNQFFEVSPTGNSQHWTMTKGIPGKRVKVQITSFSLGELDVRVNKVK